MTRRTVVLALAAAGLASGCVMMPTAPMIVALPGSQKTYEQFQDDDAACRSNAQAVVAGPGQAAAGNAAANAAAGTALGAAAGAIIGSATGNAGTGAAIGAGTGLLFGSAAGNYAGWSSYDLQYQYDAAYLQCMYARGNRVPARFAGGDARYGERPRSQAPAPYPPPNYPPPPGITPPAPSGAPTAAPQGRPT